MKDILARAEELGDAIAASDRFAAVSAARGDIESDAPLQADMQALADLGRKLAELEDQTKPIEPEEKRRLRDLQNKVTFHPKIQALARAEADFAELMNRVNRAIRGRFAAGQPTEEEEA